MWAAPFSTLVRPVEKEIWHSTSEATITTISGAPRPKRSSLPVRKAMRVTTGTVSEMVASTEGPEDLAARMQALGERMEGLRRDYQANQEYDQTLFGDEFRVEEA